MLLINPDTAFVEDSINLMFEEIQKNSKIGALGPKLISKEGLVQKSCWRKPSLLNTILSIFHLDFLNLHKNYFFKKFNETTQVESISGAALFVEKKIFEFLGGLNEDLFWMEDIDYCTRARKTGHNILYFPKTKIIHYSGKSSIKNYKKTISNQLKSKIKYSKLYNSKISTIILSLSILFICFIKISLLVFILPFSKVYRQKVGGYISVIKSMLF